MGNRRLIAVLPALLLLAACSSLRVNQDYDPATDFASYRSWSWFPAAREASGNVQLDSPLIDGRIRRAVERELGARGFRKVVDRTPDFYVHYQLSSQQKLDSTGVRTSIGIGSYGRGGGIAIGTGTPAVRQVEEGTLVIDFVDAGSRNLVWRGTGSGRLDPSATPDEVTAGVDATVAEILQQYPPGQ